MTDGDKGEAFDPRAAVKKLQDKEGGSLVALIPLDQLEFIQSRDPSEQKMIERNIRNYAEDLRRGVKFPPLDGMIDPQTGNVTIYDGNCRAGALRERGAASCSVRLSLGDRRAAVFASVQANTSHGAQRSNQTKRLAVLTLLDDPEWAAWSSTRIARQAAVSVPFVEKIRQERERAGAAAGRRLVERGGVVYEMKRPEKGGGKAPDKVEAVIRLILGKIEKLSRDERRLVAAEIYNVLYAPAT